MRKKVLKSSVIIAAIVDILAICCLDSESNIPIIVTIACSLWLGFMYFVNN